MMFSSHEIHKWKIFSNNVYKVFLSLNYVYSCIHSFIEENHINFLIHLIGKVKSLSCVQFFGIPCTVTYQAPLSMGFSRQEYWSGLPCPFQGIFPTRGSNPGLLHCRQTLYRLSHHTTVQKHQFFGAQLSL